jgi:glycine cleavage system pyridoxal-binding protein P
VLAPPGEVGSDIAVAEGQGWATTRLRRDRGIVAARMADVRRMPGRIIGETTVEGRPGYVLTLQAREQHPPGESDVEHLRADLTVAATVCLAWLGPQGAELGRRCLAKALRRRSAQIGVRCRSPVRPRSSRSSVCGPVARRQVQRDLLNRGSWWDRSSAMPTATCCWRR